MWQTQTTSYAVGIQGLKNGSLSLMMAGWTMVHWVSFSWWTDAKLFHVYPVPSNLKLGIKCFQIIKLLFIFYLDAMSETDISQQNGSSFLQTSMQPCQWHLHVWTPWNTRLRWIRLGGKGVLSECFGKLGDIEFKCHSSFHAWVQEFGSKTVTTSRFNSAGRKGPLIACKWEK